MPKGSTLKAIAFICLKNIIKRNQSHYFSNRPYIYILSTLNLIFTDVLYTLVEYFILSIPDVAQYLKELNGHWRDFRSYFNPTSWRYLACFIPLLYVEHLSSFRVLKNRPELLTTLVFILVHGFSDSLIFYKFVDLEIYKNASFSIYREILEKHCFFDTENRVTRYFTSVLNAKIATRHSYIIKP